MYESVSMVSLVCESFQSQYENVSFDYVHMAWNSYYLERTLFDIRPETLSLYSQPKKEEKRGPLLQLMCSSGDTNCRVLHAAFFFQTLH